VQNGELPKNWGLLVLKDGKLAQKVRHLKNVSGLPRRILTNSSSTRANLLFLCRLLNRGGKRYSVRDSAVSRLEGVASQEYDQCDQHIVC
jgi:hypothetical protein